LRNSIVSMTSGWVFISCRNIVVPERWCPQTIVRRGSGERESPDRAPARWSLT